MTTPDPRTTRPVHPAAWSPLLPKASGFDHLVVEKPGPWTHVAAIGERGPVVLLDGLPQHWWQRRAVAPVIVAIEFTRPDVKKESSWSILRGS